MLRRGAVIACAVSLLAAAPASAAPFTPQMDRAYAASNVFWGGPPSGCTSIDKEIVPAGWLGDHLGEATMPAPDEHAPCFLYLDRSLAQPKVMGLMCMLVFHENGHLHGLDHSKDPRNVMFPSVTGLIPACWRFLGRRAKP